MLIVPYSTENVIERLPITNILIIGSCVFVFILLLTGGLSEGLIKSMILSDWNIVGLIGHMLLHGGIFHLIFNMLYLWVFGNAVSEKIGMGKFLVVYLLAGIGGGVTHMLLDGSPVVGASGAINGIIGFYLILYPINKINCWYFFFFFMFIKAGTFAIQGYWLILFWFAVDVWSAFGEGGNVAYWAHIGGFVTGVGLAVFFLKMRWVNMADYDNPTLFGYLIKGWEDQIPERAEHKPQKAPETYNSSFSNEEKITNQSPTAPSKEDIGAFIDSEDIIPLAESKKEDVNIDCPHCLQNIDVPPELVPGRFNCPTCTGDIELLA